MTASTASLIEIFSAIQGEGLNVGTRQIFIRFGGCDLRCTYCDSAHTWQKQSTCLIEQTPGLRDFLTQPNPVTSPQLLAWIAQQDRPQLHDSISLTGGEPLLQAKFLGEFLPLLKAQTNLPLYLETGGHRPIQLASIAAYLDLVGMDIKLPSASGEEHWAAHQEFLAICQQQQLSVFTKVIIDRRTSREDLERAAQMVAAIDPNIPLFLQPVSSLAAAHSGPAPIPPEPEQVLDWQELLKKNLHSVRVIPQTHKAIGQR
jgi:7-carboxy-7-deazaguanine synthase